MIADHSSGITVESTLQGERVAMGIDPDPTVMAHIMDSLTNLYADPEKAVVREYSTNGRDATIEAGSTRPIEVTTPTSLSPFLTIRDYGIGLSVEDIHNIYSQYGTSTKRTSNAYNGTLGFGCKSALAYCDQFTVVSVKNGTKVTVVVSRDDNGGGSMTVLDTSATTDPEGTTVQIPAKSNNSILEKAERFFEVWEPGTVLLNGKPPKRFDGLRLTDDLYIIEGEQSYVVMGGVAYPAEFELPGVEKGRRWKDGRWVSGSDASILAFVPIGAVNFPPSREALRDTKNTKDTLAKIEQDFGREIKSAIQREVNAAPSPAEAIRIIIKWNKYIAGAQTVSNYTYNGESLPTGFGDHADALQVTPAANRYRGRGVATKTRSITVHDWPGSVWVHGFTPMKFTAQHKDKLTKWVEQQSLEGVQQFVLIPGAAPDSKFIDKARIVDWETIKAIKLVTSAPARPGVAGRIAGSFDVWIKDSTGLDFKHGLTGDKIDQKKPIYYHNGNRWECKRFADLLESQMGNRHFTLVCLPANRINKFCRDVPKAVKAHDACVLLYKKWLARLTKNERLALAIHDESATSEFTPLCESLVLDPAIKSAIRACKIDANNLAQQRREWRTTVNVAAEGEKWDNPLKKYPLYDESHFRGSYYQAKVSSDHIYAYLNATYVGDLPAA